MTKQQQINALIKKRSAKESRRNISGNPTERLQLAAEIKEITLQIAQLRMEAKQ